MNSSPSLSKKKQIELKVCQQFVKCFNSKYEKRYSEPETVPESKEPPDCISINLANSTPTYQFEVTKASPEEAKNIGRDREHEFFSESKDEYNEYLKQTTILYNILEKGKAAKYSAEFKSSLIILLEGANIEYYDNGDIQIIATKIFSDGQWQKRLKKLGFKEIWYVSTKDIFQLYPI